MKKIFIIANWKLNKTKLETQKWFKEFSSANMQIPASKEIVICPPFTLLSEVLANIKNLFGLTIRVGAQDVSRFIEGAYTGEVSVRQIKDFSNYVLIGHSERRRNFSESTEIVNQKIKNALEYELTPVVCVSSLNEVKSLDSSIRTSKIIIAYEPIFAIGTGIPDTPENADKMAKNIKGILGEIPVLYGGSVSKFNIKNFTNMSFVDGALVGRASLDPHEFISIIQNA